MNRKRRNPAPLAGGNRASETSKVGNVGTSEDTPNPLRIQPAPPVFDATAFLILHAHWPEIGDSVAIRSVV